MIKQIAVISKKDIGLQVLKDSLTPTEKKILIHMLNANLNEGQVKNKVFHILKTGNSTADIKIGTITKSILLGRNEITTQKVKIKYN
jgi:hypothetical protein